MIKLLVIADDFTGALDTGVQFRAKGTLIRIGGRGDADLFDAAGGDVQVLIIDAETRHMSPQDAYSAVSGIVAAAARAGVSCIYKKTDSALRGNIGSELTAMLHASGQDRLHFIPAFPRMGRTTVGGVHYIDGVPVAESVFGADPFEPVRCSAVAEIIASQSGVQTHLVEVGGRSDGQEGVLIYDAASDGDLMQIASRLKSSGQLHLLAGCAGLASVLPELLELTPDEGGLPVFEPHLLTICGSVNPITLSQLDAAERAGVLRIRLTPEQKLTDGWVESREGREAADQWLSQVRERTSAIIECGGQDGGATAAYAREIGMDIEAARRQISAAMGSILQRLLDLGLERTLLVTGGDTLMAFMKRIGQDTLIPIRELAPGVVLSQIRYRGKTFNLMSKSGGFGAETLLTDLEHIIAAQE